MLNKSKTKKLKSKNKSIKNYIKNKTTLNSPLLKSKSILKKGKSIIKSKKKEDDLNLSWKKHGKSLKFSDKNNIKYISKKLFQEDDEKESKVDQIINRHSKKILSSYKKSIYSKESKEKSIEPKKKFINKSTFVVKDFNDIINDKLDKNDYNFKIDNFADFSKKKNKNCKNIPIYNNTNTNLKHNNWSKNLKKEIQDDDIKNPKNVDSFVEKEKIIYPKWSFNNNQNINRGKTIVIKNYNQDSFKSPIKKKEVLKNYNLNQTTGKKEEKISNFQNSNFLKENLHTPFSKVEKSKTDVKPKYYLINEKTISKEAYKLNLIYQRNVGFDDELKYHKKNTNGIKGNSLSKTNYTPKDIKMNQNDMDFYYKAYRKLEKII